MVDATHDAGGDAGGDATLVSIIMPAYNSAATIGAALDSCLRQTHTPIEIIVVDDGSSDDTAAIVRDYAAHYTGVRLIQQANAGPAIARNTGIHTARGAYIQFCDSDDQLSPTKIARSLAVLQQARTTDERVALAYCRMQHVAADGKTPLEREPSPLLHTPDATQPHATFCALLRANGSPLQTSTLLIRKDALLDVGAYRADDQRCAEDWDLLLRLAQVYRFVGEDAVLVRYRHTPNALTTQTLEMAHGRLQTVIYARDYAARQHCMDDAAYAVLLAGRHHVVAMAHWRANNRAAARQHFQQAIALTPHGRRARRLLWLASWALPARWLERP